MSGMPTWEEFNVPVLTVLSDGATRTLRELRRDVADAVGLTAEQRAETLASGQLPRRQPDRLGGVVPQPSRRAPPAEPRSVRDHRLRT